MRRHWRQDIELNSQAAHLNDQLPPRILSMLSTKGKAIYFPNEGILAQSAAARGCRINGTIGIALDESGEPLHLSGLNDMVGLAPGEAFPYTSSYGKPALRDRWLEMLLEKNPSLEGLSLSRPVVTNALTHGLSVTASLFGDAGDRLIMPDRFWGNYALVFNHGFGVRLQTYSTFHGAGFHVDGLRNALGMGPPGKRLVLLNFPNNPTGYTCTEREADQIVEVLVASADQGCDLVVIVDDAYFGLVYEPGILKESIFARLAAAHPGLLAVKVDGATKEDFAWGYRVGFITFGYGGADQNSLDVLADKAAGTVRGSISNASHLSQSLILSAYNAPDYPGWKARTSQVLRTRYETVRHILNSHPEYAKSFTPEPFNSGYFLCVRPVGVRPEQVRQILVEDFDTGVITVGDLIRIAYSSVACKHLPTLFENLHAAIGHLQDSQVDDLSSP